MQLLKQCGFPSASPVISVFPAWLFKLMKRLPEFVAQLPVGLLPLPQLFPFMPVVSMVAVCSNTKSPSTSNISVAAAFHPWNPPATCTPLGETPSFTSDMSTRKVTVIWPISFACCARPKPATRPSQPPSKPATPPRKSSRSRRNTTSPAPARASA